MSGTRFQRDVEHWLERLREALERREEDNLLSFVVYGSVARGTAAPGSDVDLVLVFRSLPVSRHDRFTIWHRVLEELRAVAVEPARTHDPSATLHANVERFPGWFGTRVADLAAISAELAGDRGIAFCGDERQGIPPDQLFGRDDAERAMEQVAFVRGLCERLVSGE